MDAIFLRNLCRLSVLSFLILIITTSSYGQTGPGVWDPVDSAWKGINGQTWTLKGRTGLVSDSGRYYRTAYYVNEKIKGFLEYLPTGYTANNVTKFPLIIYYPGCGEIHNGQMYLHGPGGQPNYYYGTGRFFAQGNPPPKDIRMNIGGTNQEFSGERWWAETIGEFSTYLAIGGTATYNFPAAAISGTSKPGIYRTGRTGQSFSYAIPMANGSYRLRLHFAELELNAPGNQFSVTAEGNSVLSNFDIYSTAGANTAYIRDVNVTVNGGVFNLSFNAGAGDVAKVSAIEITANNPSTPPFSFPAIPSVLRDNGDYFSNIPQKTLGLNYPTSGGPRQGVIVLSMMQSGDPLVCAGSQSTVTDDDVQAAIDLAFKTYRIDPTRVYLTGMSAGGGVSYTYPGSSLDRARTFAAVAPVAAVTTILDDPAKGSNIINGGTSVLAVTNYLDYNTNGTGANAYANNVAAIANLNSFTPIVPRQVTFYTFIDDWQNMGQRNHNGWERAYRYQNPDWDTRPAVFIDNATASGTPEKYTVYEWFLINQNLASPLPVLLKTFTATRINNTVELDWTTSTEINSSFFTLERSVDGMNFSPLTKVDAAGNSVTEKKYKHIDNNLPGSAYVYYRLSQTDKDGKKQIFGIRKVFIGSSGFELRVFPTLTTGTLNIEVQGVSSDAMNIRIVDLSGKVLMKQVIAPRQNRLTMDVGRLAKGMYILQADNSVHRFTTKFIKQ